MIWFLQMNLLWHHCFLEIPTSCSPSWCVMTTRLSPNRMMAGRKWFWSRESRSAAQWAALTQRRPLQRTMARPGCTAVTLVDVTQQWEGLNEAERDLLSSQGVLVCYLTVDEGLHSLLISEDGDIIIIWGQIIKTFQTTVFLTVTSFITKLQLVCTCSTVLFQSTLMYLHSIRKSCQYSTTWRNLSQSLKYPMPYVQWNVTQNNNGKWTAPI